MAEQEYDIMKPMVGIMMIGVMAALIIPMITPPAPPPPTYCCAICEELGTPVCFYTYAELEAHFAAEHPGESPTVSPAISIGDITWESEDGSPLFEMGGTYIAKVIMTNPTTEAFDYSAALYMGTNQVIMAEATFHLDAEESKEVSFSVTMPEAPGEYPVSLTVSSGGELLEYYQAASITIVGAPAIEVSDITWGLDGTPQFGPGSTQSAKVTMVNPTTRAFDYSAILCMGIGRTIMAEEFFHLDAGESKEITFTVVMPTTEGQYPVYLSVFSGDVLLQSYQSATNVTILPTAAEFYMPSEISGRAKYWPLLQWQYHAVDFWVSITNKGNTAGTVRLTWSDTIDFVEGGETMVLGPGETKEWRVGSGMRIDFTRASPYTLTLVGDWVGNNVARITVRESQLSYVEDSGWVDL